MYSNKWGEAAKEFRVIFSDARVTRLRRRAYRF